MAGEEIKLPVKPVQTAPYLRDTRPGREKMPLHHWSEHLACEAYMVPCQELPDKATVVAGIPVILVGNAGDPNRITLIKEVLPRVAKAPNGMPRIDSLNKILNWSEPATREEKNIAWKELTGNAGE